MYNYHLKTLVRIIMSHYLIKFDDLPKKHQKLLLSTLFCNIVKDINDFLDKYYSI